MRPYNFKVWAVPTTHVSFSHLFLAITANVIGAQLVAFE